MSLNLFQAQFPPPNTPIIDPMGLVTTPWMAFLRAMFGRTGQGTGTPFSAGDNLVAAGTTQATALALTNDWNNITSGATFGIILPALTMGQSVVVFNNAGGNIKMYPPVGGALTVLGVATGINLPYVSAAPDSLIFYYFSNTNIIAI